ncbi:juvenile hormone esterase-like, partial [Rhodnius prolixus]|uniref:juvenile hormone esterase-like n=1 Tax=Rhodnius prolixus TaxID=13249 RepID=UPI003D1893C5
LSVGEPSLASKRTKTIVRVPGQCERFHSFVVINLYNIFILWKEPQPPEPWSGIREGYNFGSVCVQIPFVYPATNTTKIGNEDCLYLSVYSPNVKPKDLLPVLVYLHYGAFFFGSGEIDKSPEYFLDHDLIVVMPNYRLGVLGFLTMEDDVMPANLGMKDQVMALKWIQDNIVNFGGDPNQVTLIGDSSGGASAHYHMFSPMSRGLFHRAISQSVTVLGGWVNTLPGLARSRAIKMAQLFNCSTESSKEVLDCLRTKNVFELTESNSKFELFQEDPVAVFVPTFCENSSNPFLPLNPFNAEPAPIPWIVSLCSLEGSVRTAGFVTNPDDLTEFDNKFHYAAPIALLYDNTSTNPEEVTQKIREFYFDSQPITMKLLRNLTDMFTDGMFTWPTVEALQKHKGPHYLYYFDYLGEYTFQVLFAGKRFLTGSAHMDDALYIWRNRNPIEIPAPSTSQDLYISKLLVKLFYNFASLGEPTPSGFDFNWPQWDNQQQNFINIGNSGVTINSTLLPDRVQFWSQLNYRDKVDSQCGCKNILV